MKKHHCLHCSTSRTSRGDETTISPIAVVPSRTTGRDDWEALFYRSRLELITQTAPIEGICCRACDASARRTSVKAQLAAALREADSVRGHESHQ